MMHLDSFYSWARVACSALTKGVRLGFLISFLWALGLDLGGSLLLSSVFGVEDGVGPGRPLIEVMGIVDQIFR